MWLVSSMSETETETEHDRKVREYWAKAYDDLIKDKKDNKNYEPTAVLSRRNTKQFSVYDIANLNLSNE
jgi:hypothetical protein